MGHRTVAFTEPQIYHLLRVLTDEAISMTCTTMEQMVIGAVKGMLATAPSRTGQFKSRAQTPRPHQAGSSSSEGFLTDPGQDSEASGDFSALLEVGGISMPEDNDSSEEMALIANSFKRSSIEKTRPAKQSPTLLESVGRGDESTGQSSLDATLSELREQPSTQLREQPTRAASRHCCFLGLLCELSSINPTHEASRAASNLNRLIYNFRCLSSHTVCLATLTCSPSSNASSFP